MFSNITNEKLDYGLYIVATPIGNMEDITYRALKILTNADKVICEERKVGSRLLRYYGIKKEIMLLNEHNEKDSTYEIINYLLNNKEAVALISDAGTPLFADPGNDLVWQCMQHNIPVKPIPGVSSLMTALMASGITSDKFLYYGFLPANRDERIQELRRIKSKDKTDMIFLDTPYRLKKLLLDMKMALGRDRQAIIAYKLTQPEEKIFWGNLEELCIMTEDLPKGEFVIILKKKGKKRRR